MDLTDKSILVFDKGLYSFVAEKLSKHYGTVYYYTPSLLKSLPEMSENMIGTGIENVTRINSFWDYVDNVDVILFCDVFGQDIQNYLLNNGYPVVGSLRSSILEADRTVAKNSIINAGLPVMKYKVIYGMDELKSYLKNVDNKVVKVNPTIRGETETFRHKTFVTTEPILNMLSNKLGKSSNRITFIVEDMVDIDVEYGYDGYQVDGQFPEWSLCGIENKDKCYLGSIVRYDELDDPIREANDKMSPVFQSLGYQGFYSNEIIKSGGLGYLIDFTCRMPLPPICSQMEVYENFPDIVYSLSRGEVINPEYKRKYAGEIIIYTKFTDSCFVPLLIPDDIRDHVYIYRHARIDGQDFAVVDERNTAVCSVAFASDSLDDLILELKYMAGKIEGLELSYDADALDEIKDKVEKVKKT